MSEIISETLREITPRLADDGRYTIVSAIREGRLYLADRAGKRFVLKTAHDAKGLEMLKREYELSSRLQHPFIASALLWEDDSPVGPAIVIEYVRGRNLAGYLGENPSLKARERVFDQILDAVGSIHRQSIIHNDIKPENILITEADDDVKIIDFGFADADSHFLEKSIGGTRLYASPELLANETTDARSDIYSIGILMKDMFPGRYGSIARKCCCSIPGKRYQNIDDLKYAWRNRQKLPLLLWIILPVGAVLALWFVYMHGARPYFKQEIPKEYNKPDTIPFVSAKEEIPELEPEPETAQTDTSVSVAKTAKRHSIPVAIIDETVPSSEVVHLAGSALSIAETRLRQAWEQSFNQVCSEMDQAGYVDFLHIHVDYGTYEIDPVWREVSAGFSGKELSTLDSLNNALNMDYCHRLYDRYESLPSLYDKSLNLPEDERKYYLRLVSNFKKYTPYQ